MSAQHHDGVDHARPAGLSLRGGTTTRVRPEDLAHTAASLSRAAGRLTEVHRILQGVTALVDRAEPDSPTTAAWARDTLAAGTSPLRGARSLAWRSEDLASAVRRAAEVLDRAELDVGVLVRTAATVHGAAATRSGPLGWLAAAAQVAVVAVAGAQTTVLAHVLARTGTAVARSPTPVGALLRAHPMTRTALADGVLARATAAPLSGLPRAGAVEVAVGGLAASVDGLRPGPPRPGSVRSAADVLAAGAGTVSRVAGVGATSLQVRAVAAERRTEEPPSTVTHLLAAVADDYPTAAEEDGTVTVRRIDRPDGTRSWVVTIPGTQNWSPVAGTNPADLTSDLELVAGRADDATAMVLAAIEDAGIGADEPVVLAGHSLGGLVAMKVAADPALTSRATVTGVLTAGSPVGGMELPGTVQALHLEHPQDYVPTLDATPNADRWNRVTVQHDLTRSADPRDREALDPVGSHTIPGYVRSARAVDRLEDPRLDAFRAVLRDAAGGAGARATVTRYTGHRVPVDGTG